MAQPPKPKHNPNYNFLHKNWAAKRFFLLQGSGRSGKTYSIIDFIIWLCCRYKNAGLEIDICRESLIVLKATVLKDLIERLNQFGLYSEARHDMSNKIYNLKGNFINYYSAEDEMKARGRKRNIFWGNEPNNFSLDFIRAVLLRTTNKLIFDYNPSDPIGVAHWLYDDIMLRDNACTLITTWQDNIQYLSKEQIEEFENLEKADAEYYKVFGLGQRAAIGNNIFNHYKFTDSFPEFQDYCYGLDFGYNHPAALTFCGFHEGVNYWKEVLFQTKLSNTDLIDKLKELIPDKNKEIFADSARPDIINEIYLAGFNIHAADKNVSEGIKLIKSMPLFIHSQSVNLINELGKYKYKTDKNGQPVDPIEPVKFLDDLIDAGRYGTFSRLNKQFKGGHITWAL